MKIKEFIGAVIIGIILGGCLTLWGQSIFQKADELKNKEETEVANVKWRHNHFKLNESNLYDELIAQGVEFPDIVLAQAILETGYFKSHACMNKNNLFGLRKGDGTYMSFDHWTDAVAAYVRYIQKWEEPPTDYYRYLDKLGYAEDSSYIAKVKEIVRQNRK